MINEKKLVVVMPAYNAERTLRQTFAELPHEYVDETILVDDASRDGTVQVARELGIRTILHPENRGYGGNQKTCYRSRARRGGRHRRHAPPRLPVLPAAGHRHGLDGRLGPLRRRARLPDPRRPGAAAAGCRSTSTSPTAS